MQEPSGTQPADPGETPPAGAQPRLLYDGDCGFCFYWARYWQRLTGDSVDYRPYQQVLEQYPAIPEAEFQRAVQFVAPDGRRASAAEASFLTLAKRPAKGSGSPSIGACPVSRPSPNSLTPSSPGAARPSSA